MKKFFTMILLSIFTVSISKAAGFRLAEQSASAAAMGNAFVAVANDASSVWYNPAAMINLEGTQISAGSVMVYPLMKHEYTGGSDKSEKKLHIPPHFYAAHKYNENLAFGLGINAPFGLSTDWDKNTAVTKSVATFSEIKNINLNINGAYKLNEKLSFAAGLNYSTLEAQLNKWFVSDEMTLEGSGNGMGYNAALMYRNDKWKFGANYRSQIKIKIDGKISHPLIGGTFDDANTEITLPDLAQIGASYKHCDSWLFTAEADYTNWSTYDKVTVNWNNDTGTDSDIKDWKGVWALKLGTEYKYSDIWKFRGGLLYDMNPVTSKRLDTRLPDSDRLAFSIGAGYEKNNLSIDAVYIFAKFTDRTISNSYAGGAVPVTSLDGKYSSTAHLPGITISYKY